jgi:tetratricopeptide (TPR) repeat protein
MPVTICLNMIVKNEAPVIRRCLDSVRPFIDRWVVVDTGSTDGTQDIIRRHLADIPGELHERPWRDFAHNRTEALELARGHADYLLFIDADETLRASAGFVWPALDADAYFLHAEYGSTIYSRCALVSTRLAWRWVGVLHEYLTSTPEAQRGHLEWPRIVVSHDGARARDPDTYRKDAEVLENALREEPDNARYAFYLAQTWRDAGEPLKARAAYRRRAAMPGWDEEIWMALYEVGRMGEALRAPIGEIQGAYLAAYQFRPRRSEPLYQLARFHRERGEFALAYLFARQAAGIPRPPDLLFVDAPVYLWRSLDELSVAASYVDALDEGKAVTERLLAEGHVPPHERARVEANLGFFDGALAKRHASTPALASPPAARIAWTICIVTPPGYEHSQAFAEIARGLQEAFAELGEVAPIVQDPKAIVGRGLVLGANLLPRVPEVKLPDDAVVFNLEQVSDSGVWLNESYLDVLRTHEVWDYSESNIASLRARGIERVRQCSIGYAPCLTRIAPAVDEDVDVLFVGSIYGRRIPILDAIETAGLRVQRLYGVYGAQRDAWIARARIVLNLHAYPEQVFEIARVSYLLANRRFVISELSRGTDSVEVALRGGVVLGSQGELPELCRRFAVDEAARRTVAQRGFELFRAMRQADFLRAVLDGGQAAQAPR